MRTIADVMRDSKTTKKIRQHLDIVVSEMARKSEKALNLKRKNAGREEKA